MDLIEKLDKLLSTFYVINAHFLLIFGLVTLSVERISKKHDYGVTKPKIPNKMCSLKSKNSLVIIFVIFSRK